MLSRGEGKRVRYAVVGAGHIAQTAMLPAFEHARESAELVAIISGDPLKRQELGSRYGLQHLGGYEEYEEVLRASGAQAVYISLPNNLHREYTERAARAGVHVLCEKPMAVTVPECEAMNAAAREHNVKLMIAYRLHFEEANLRALKILRDGLVGEPILFTSTLTQQVRRGDIRTRDDVGGGALLDLGVYPVNAARNLFDQEPIEVTAYASAGRDERFHDVDDTVVALLRFPGNRFAQMAISQAAAGLSNFQIVGSRGDLRVEAAYEYEGPRRHQLSVGGKTKKKKFSARDQFAPQLVYFARCILEGLEPEPSGHEGMADVRVLAALREAAGAGTSVALEPWEKARRPDLSLLINKPPVRKPATIHAQAPTVG
jgi:predicted dehydrogenase